MAVSVDRKVRTEDVGLGLVYGSLDGPQRTKFGEGWKMSMYAGQRRKQDGPSTENRVSVQRPDWSLVPAVGTITKSKNW
ncbi:Hypothetical protein NTJ_10343 [Nesidiocoris tenuis]|uniref:Uncharacterized protein n=1 Tax=Nesidiocoris tenuis TaxID=355587 RepID=A0ABN7AZC8_9HEMI|nr:Hypothetical protein NTJ_10343 [Nesidiocoris tenuis]